MRFIWTVFLSNEKTACKGLLPHNAAGVVLPFHLTNGPPPDKSPGTKCGWMKSSRAISAIAA